MLTMCSHIKPKALSQSGKADRERAIAAERKRIGAVYSRHIGAGRSVSTKRFADSIGVSEAYVKAARNTPEALPMAGEMRMLASLEAGGTAFANDILRPYGYEVRRIPASGAKVSWYEVIRGLGQIQDLMLEHASDGVHDLGEARAQYAAKLALQETLAVYGTSHLLPLIETGRPVRLTLGE
ncbi:MAG: hypothetical protein VX464_20805 [Pseudomonadota bacterium]|nr:hypothetical protein [Pseudomonadota bacterium]